MPIIFRCENCRQKLSVRSNKAGQTLECPKCRQETQIPNPRATKPKDDLASAPTRELPEAEIAAEEKGFAPTAELPENQIAPTKETAVWERPEDVDPDDFAGPVAAMADPPASVTHADEEEEEEFTLRKAASELEEMDLTPMVDVTFLLLIFFMITASFSLTKAIETPAPDPENKGAQSLQTLEELEMTSIMVRIDDQDGIFVDDEPAEAYDLENVLADLLRSEKKNELVITASPKSRHETFVTVFDAATSAGMQKIRLASPQGGGDE